MTRFRTIARYSSYLLGSRLLSRLLFTVFFIYAASRLGPEVFGALSFALVTVELLSSIGDLGITRYAARELVRNWGEGEILAGEVLLVQSFTSVLFSLGGLIVIWAYSPDYPKLQLLLLAMVAVLFSAIINTAEAIFIATQKFFYSAFLTFIGKLVYVIIGFIALYEGASVVVIMMGFVAGVILEAILRLAVVLMQITRFSFAFSKSRLLSMLKAIQPFALSAAAHVVFIRANIIILEILKGDAAVGVFNIAYTLFIPFVWLPMIIQRTAFPGLTKIYASDTGKAQIHTWQWYRFMAIIGIPIAIIASMLAIPVISLFPRDYEDSVSIFIILMSTIPPMLYSTVGFNILQVIDRERSSAYAASVAALASIVLSFIFIYYFNVIGAAVALLFATMILAASLYYLVRKYFLKRSALLLFAKPAIAGVIMLIVSLILWQFNRWLAIGIAAAVYILTILLLKVFRIAEIKTLLRD